jgi:hypothetical protein
MQAIETIKDDRWENLQHDAYSELSTAFLPTDQVKAQVFLDSAQVSGNKYHQLSAKGIVDFTEKQIELDKAAREINQLQRVKRKNRIIFHTALVFLIVVNITFILISNMRKRVKTQKPHYSLESKESFLFNDFKVWLEDGKRYLQPDLDLSRLLRRWVRTAAISLKLSTHKVKIHGNYQQVSDSRSNKYFRK